MWMTTPMTIILKEKGYLVAAESGTTMRCMERHRAAHRKVDRSSRKRDQEVTEQTEDRGRGSAVEGARPQQSPGNPLEQANRLKSEETIDEERSGNVQDAAGEAAP